MRTLGITAGARSERSGAGLLGVAAESGDLLTQAALPVQISPRQGHSQSELQFLQLMLTIAVAQGQGGIRPRS